MTVQDDDGGACVIPPFCVGSIHDDQSALSDGLFTGPVLAFSGAGSEPALEHCLSLSESVG
jgi:hypothetical protein